MLRLFSMFPAGVPGIALLLLRIGVSATIFATGWNSQVPVAVLLVLVLLCLFLSSVITSNPATCDHPKTGQRTEPRNIDSCTAPTRVPARAFCCPARNVLLPARKIP